MPRTLRNLWLVITVPITFSIVAACTPLKPVPPSDHLPRLSELQPDGLTTHPEFNMTHSPVVVLRRTDNNLLVRPLVNGRDLGWFILDTGASGMTITPRAAERAGLAAIASTTMQGQLPTTVYQGQSLRIGQLTLVNPRFAGLDMPWSKFYFGEHVQGICGWDVFAHSIVEIDMRLQRVSVHEPSTISLALDQWQHIQLVNGRPHVHGEFESQDGKRGQGEFLLDTGYSGEVWLFPTAADQFQLHGEASGRKRKMVMVDASASVRSLTLQWFEFAGRRVERIEAAMTSGRGKTRQERMPIMGMIGLGSLHDARVFIDYQNERIAVLSDPE